MIKNIRKDPPKKWSFSAEDFPLAISEAEGRALRAQSRRTTNLVAVAYYEKTIALKEAPTKMKINLC
jgi:hypothetical protein